MHCPYCKKEKGKEVQMRFTGNQRTNTGNWECPNCSTIAKDSQWKTTFIDPHGDVSVVKKTELTPKIINAISTEVETIFCNFMFYDRKECEDLPLELFERLQLEDKFKDLVVRSFIKNLEKDLKCRISYSVNYEES